MKKINVLALLLFVAVDLVAEEFEVGQERKKFSVDVLTIKQGDTVRFTNQDPFFHNIYSFSSIKPFDLGSFPKGESASIKFERHGVIDVRCAIHPKMEMQIKVVD